MWGHFPPTVVDKPHCGGLLRLLWRVIMLDVVVLLGKLEELTGVLLRF